MKLCTDLVAHGFQKCMFDDKKKKAVDYLGLIVKDFLLTWNWYTSSGEHMKLNPEATQWFVPPQKRMLLSWTWWWDVSSNYHSYLWNSQTICQYLIQLEWNKMVRRCSSHVIWQGCGGKKSLQEQSPSTNIHTHLGEGLKAIFCFSWKCAMPLASKQKRRWNSILMRVVWQKQDGKNNSRKKHLDHKLQKARERRGGHANMHLMWYDVQFNEYVDKYETW